MSQYFVGQRVKTIGAENKVFKEMVGKEGTITAEDPNRPNCWIVDIDGYGEHWYPGSNAPCSWSARHLAPLTPPHEPGDWAVIDKLLPHLRAQEKEPA